MPTADRKSLPKLCRLPKLMGKGGRAVDLLGRPVVSLDTPELQRFIAGKVILVTGAGGSIGSEICRQCLRYCPQRLVLVERSENALFEVDRELREQWVGAEIVPALADVTDRRRLASVLSEHRPHVVFHAAAHKHVPMMEANPGEAIKNNVFGTQIAAELSAEYGASAFVLISTDKAVNPTSVMGATKRVAEMVVQSWQGRGSGAERRAPLGPRPASHRTQLGLPPCETQDPKTETRTRFTAVRFGNVLGSSGSVVPIFRRQIERGGPVTVTHADMQRYFMTIPEASQLVMQAGAIGRGGEVFVLDMGQPVRILDLARRMIRAAGKRPGKDIEIRVTGIRPGEKLFEELACESEATLPTGHDRIRVWRLPAVGQREVEGMLASLAEVADAPAAAVIERLARWVPEFTPGTAVRPAMRVVRPSDESGVAAA